MFNVALIRIKSVSDAVSSLFLFGHIVLGLQMRWRLMHLNGRGLRWGWHLGHRVMVILYRSRSHRLCGSLNRSWFRNWSSSWDLCRDWCGRRCWFWCRSGPGCRSRSRFRCGRSLSYLFWCRPKSMSDQFILRHDIVVLLSVSGMVRLSGYVSLTRMIVLFFSVMWLTMLIRVIIVILLVVRTSALFF